MDLSAFIESIPVLGCGETDSPPPSRSSCCGKGSSGGDSMIWPIRPTPAGSTKEALSGFIVNLVSEAYPPGPLMDPGGARDAARTVLGGLRKHFSGARVLIAALEKGGAVDELSAALVRQQHWLLLQLAHELCDRIRRCDARESLRIAKRMKAILLEHLKLEESLVFGIRPARDAGAEEPRETELSPRSSPLAWEDLC
jgi:hypothetical protein